jgi:hypothetical protein
VVSSIYRRASATFWFVLNPFAVIAQLPGSNPSPVVLDRAVYASPQRVSRAIVIAGGYLERNCDTSGRFAYLVDTDSGEVSPSYNVVRHAGAIYALAMMNSLHPDPNAVNTGPGVRFHANELPRA